jgi:hypothetical protein
MIERSSPGVQTERRGDAGPVRDLLDGKAAPGDSFNSEHEALPDADFGTAVAMAPHALAGRHALLQPEDLEAALPVRLASRRGLGIAARLHRRFELAWFHDGASFRSISGLRYD